MKRIYKNNDLAFNITINNFPIDKDLINSIKIKFYTTNSNNCITKTQDDIVDNQVILQWNELQYLEKGVMYYDCTVSLVDETMKDGTLDTVTKRMTNYYICSGIDELDSEYSNYYTKEEVNQLIDNVTTSGEINLTNYYTKSQTDSMLKDYVEEDVLGSYYTKNEVNELIDNIDIPVTDLTNYYKKAETYSKEEVNQLIDGVTTNGEVNLSNYYTKNEVDSKIPTDYITSIPSEYVTESELNAKGYLTQHQSLSNYYNKSEVDNKLKGYATSSHTHSNYSTTSHTHSQYITNQSLSGYAKLSDIPTDYVTESRLNSKGYLTAVPSEYVTETELNAKGYLTAVPSQYVTEAELEAKDYISVIPSEYVTETELERKGYLTEHQSLNNYYTKNQVNDLIDGITTGDGEVNLTNYYTKSEVDNLIDNIECSSGSGETTDLSNYYTKGEVDNLIPTDYAKKEHTHSDYVSNFQIWDMATKTNLNDYYKKSEVDELIDNIEIPTGGTSNVDSTNYYTKGEVDELIDSIEIPTDYIKAVNIGQKDDTDFQVQDGIVNIYNQMYNGGYELTIDGTSVFGIKPIDDSIILESAGGTANGNFRCGIKVNPDILTGGTSYDDTALTNRVSALESELTGVSELISRLNDLIV